MNGSDKSIKQEQKVQALSDLCRYGKGFPSKAIPHWGGLSTCAVNKSEGGHAPYSPPPCTLPPHFSGLTHKHDLILTWNLTDF